MSNAAQIDFPPIETADDDGLLMLGGRLNAAWVMAAYLRGIFPWPLDESPNMPAAWWSPDPRAVIEFDDFHASRRLHQTIRSGRFTVTTDRNFAEVIASCAEPRGDDNGVWLTAELQQAFVDLHQLGYAHSVEVWRNDQLAGGVYGLAIGGYFSAESMFHRQRDASKVALAYLVEHLREKGYQLLDIQVITEHTERMGATEISRDDFLARLQQALPLPIRFSADLT